MAVSAMTGQTIRLAAFVEAEPALRDIRFDNCRLIGPAIIVPTAGTVITGSRFGGDPKGLFWTTAGPWPNGLTGVIGAVNCVFSDCEFVNIGIAGPPESIEKMRAGFGPAPPESGPPSQIPQ